MRSCYSPHPGYQLFAHTSPDKALEGEKVFDDERISGLLRRSLELGHYDILEHNSITWLVNASEKDILSLLDSSKFFETSQVEEEKWIVTTNLRVLVELARAKNPPPLSRELVATLITAAPSIASTLAATVKSGMIRHPRSSCSVTPTIPASSPIARKKVSRWGRTTFYGTEASHSTYKASVAPPATRSYVTELPVSPSNHNVT